MANTTAQSLKRTFDEIDDFEPMFGYLYHVKKLQAIKERTLFQK